VSAFPVPEGNKTLTWTMSDDFEAYNAAEHWLTDRGFSIGRLNGDAPVGFKEGDWDIAKWWNLSASDIKQLDGVITSPDFRHGPVTV